MLKATSKRLANRSVVYGRTVFKFDKDGVCSVPKSAKYDYDVMIKQNGISAYRDTPKPVVVAPAPKPVPAIRKPVVAAPAPKPVPAIRKPVPAPVVAPKPKIIAEADPIVVPDVAASTDAAWKAMEAAPVVPSEEDTAPGTPKAKESEKKTSRKTSKKSSKKEGPKEVTPDSSEKKTKRRFGRRKAAKKSDD